MTVQEATKDGGMIRTAGLAAVCLQCRPKQLFKAAFCMGDNLVMWSLFAESKQLPFGALHNHWLGHKPPGVGLSQVLVPPW